MPADYLAALDPVGLRGELAGAAARPDARGRAPGSRRDEDGIVGLATCGPARDEDAPTAGSSTRSTCWPAAHGTGVADALCARRSATARRTCGCSRATGAPTAFYHRHGFADDGGEQRSPRPGSSRSGCRGTRSAGNAQARLTGWRRGRTAARGRCRPPDGHPQGAGRRRAGLVAAPRADEPRRGRLRRVTVVLGAETVESRALLQPRRLRAGRGRGGLGRGYGCLLAGRLAVPRRLARRRGGGLAGRPSGPGPCRVRPGRRGRDGPGAWRARRTTGSRGTRSSSAATTGPGGLETARGDQGARAYLAPREVLLVECGDLATGARRRPPPRALSPRNRPLGAGSPNHRPTRATVDWRAWSRRHRRVSGRGGGPAGSDRLPVRRRAGHGHLPDAGDAAPAAARGRARHGQDRPRRGLAFGRRPCGGPPASAVLPVPGSPSSSSGRCIASIR